ncbi:DUF6338 family protein [Pseudarthrobacter sp. MDT3-1]
MTVPSSLPELFFFAAMVVPGITYAWAKRRFVGWQAPNQDVGARVLEALFVSAAFLIAYGALFFAISGATIADAAVQLDAVTQKWHGAWVWILGAVLLVGLPTLASYFINARWVKTPMSDGTVKRKQVNRSKDTPRGWDKCAFSAYTPRFVRIKTSNGSWYGGWFDSDSLVSTYPHEKDIFIQMQWQMGPDGEFIAAVEESLGVWVPVTNDCIVEWLAAPADQESNEEDYVHAE